MNFGKKFVNIVSVAAVMVGMTAGIASAQLTDTEDTVLSVTCPETATVGVAVSGDFTVDATGGASSYDAHLPGGFEITMDLTCNWSNDFQVSADIGTFQYQGVAPGGAADAFGGSHLYWDNGSGVYSGPDLYLLAGAPNVEGTVFEFFQTGDPDVIENAYDTFIFWSFPVASPGITVATWDGHLYNLPANLAGGEYIAPLTVELTVN